jgi:hypothetical protein
VLLYISFTSYWEGIHDILRSFVKPHKPVLLEENNDDVAGMLRDCLMKSNHLKKFTRSRPREVVEMLWLDDMVGH